MRRIWNNASGHASAYAALGMLAVALGIVVGAPPLVESVARAEDKTANPVELAWDLATQGDLHLRIERSGEPSGHVEVGVLGPQRNLSFIEWDTVDAPRLVMQARGAPVTFRYESSLDEVHSEELIARIPVVRVVEPVTSGSADRAAADIATVLAREAGMARRSTSTPKEVLTLLGAAIRKGHGPEALASSVKYATACVYDRSVCGQDTGQICSLTLAWPVSAVRYQAQTVRYATCTSNGELVGAGRWLNGER